MRLAHLQHTATDSGSGDCRRLHAGRVQCHLFSLRISVCVAERPASAKRDDTCNGRPKRGGGFWHHVRKLPGDKTPPNRGHAAAGACGPVCTAAAHGRGQETVPPGVLQPAGGSDYHSARLHRPSGPRLDVVNEYIGALHSSTVN
eukprot:CAMPEP_0177751016 /NCGR_PEP_ID=MMETSP0491_2-20121128/149_1 /TAXON_ID=63592 /ORGANISM="Tetraselmis chuii, Strain PLY429" /LENGTH=144 /DNA_ID=CAMNT_0019266101 /DNA_START=1019 /DNA_END=1453 /DNA_ORIENTATION=-